MNNSHVNVFNQHTPFIFSNTIPPNGPHTLCGGSANIISNKVMSNFSTLVPVPQIAMRGGGIDAQIDSNYTGGEIEQMHNYVLQTGGKIRKDQSISEAFFDLLKKRKTLAVERKTELQKGFKTLLHSRKKMFSERKAKLGKSLGNVYSRSPASRLVGRDMQQRNNNRIVLKSKSRSKSKRSAIGRSIGRSMGRSMSIAGGGKKTCLSSCKLRGRRHKHKGGKHVRFALQHGGVGYSTNDINLPPNLSMLASPASFTPSPPCVGLPYQHYV